MHLQIGSGFEATKMRGSEHNDRLLPKERKVEEAKSSTLPSAWSRCICHHKQTGGGARGEERENERERQRGKSESRCTESKTSEETNGIETEKNAEDRETKPEKAQEAQEDHLQRLQLCAEAAKNLRCETNSAGGTLGGISTGGYP